MAKRPLRMPDRSEVTDDTPLRLAVAAALAYPDSSMTASGLRKERDAGRLMTELTAGKEFTTLADIGRMRELCRRKSKPEPAPQIGRPLQTDGQPAMERASAALARTIHRITATDDAQCKAERAARQKEREAAHPDYRARLEQPARKMRPPKAKG